MAASKLLNTWAVAADVEVTYGTDVTPDGADGVLVVERPEVEKAYVHDGTRGAAAGIGGTMRGVAPSGLSGEVDLVAEAHGSKAAYAAAVVPSIHTLLLIAGFEATLVASTSYTYAQESGPTDFDSGSVYIYSRGQLEKLTGVYADMSISADGPGVPLWTFPLMGIAAAQTDAATLPITAGYPAGTNLPPKATSIALTLNAVSSFKVRGFNLALNREIAPRADDNGDGLAGFSPGGRDIDFEVTVEATPIATFNPYSIWDLGTVFPGTVQLGSVAFEKWKITMSQLQIMDVAENDDGPTALWTIQMKARASTPSLDDDISILFD